jgi:hypothetical protein
VRRAILHLDDIAGPMAFLGIRTIQERGWGWCRFMLQGLSQTFPDQYAGRVRGRNDLTFGCAFGFQTPLALLTVGSIQVRQSATPSRIVRGKTLRQAQISSLQRHYSIILCPISDGIFSFLQNFIYRSIPCASLPDQSSFIQHSYNGSAVAITPDFDPAILDPTSDIGIFLSETISLGLSAFCLLFVCWR